MNKDIYKPSKEQNWIKEKNYLINFFTKLPIYNNNISNSFQNKELFNCLEITEFCKLPIWFKNKEPLNEDICLYELTCFGDINIFKNL